MESSPGGLGQGSSVRAWSGLLVPFGCGLRSQGLPCTRDQGLLFGFVEFRGRVHWKIKPRRHIPLTHLCGNVLGVTLGMVPLRKIQMSAAAIYVPLDKPGDRRNVGVPRPYGLVAMAVITGALD